MTSPDDEYTPIEDYLNPEERDIETPTADAAEQSTPLVASEERPPLRTAFEADDYDAIEQSRVVELDDDY